MLDFSLNLTRLISKKRKIAPVDTSEVKDPVNDINSENILQDFSSPATIPKGSFVGGVRVFDPEDKEDDTEVVTEDETEESEVSFFRAHAIHKMKTQLSNKQAKSEVDNKVKTRSQSKNDEQS